MPAEPTHSAPLRVTRESSWCSPSAHQLAYGATYENGVMKERWGCLNCAFTIGRTVPVEPQEATNVQ